MTLPRARRRSCSHGAQAQAQARPWPAWRALRMPVGRGQCPGRPPGHGGGRAGASTARAVGGRLPLLPLPGTQRRRLRNSVTGTVTLTATAQSSESRQAPQRRRELQPAFKFADDKIGHSQNNFCWFFTLGVHWCGIFNYKMTRFRILAGAAFLCGAASQDVATVSLSGDVLQPRHISDRFVGFSLEVSAAPVMFAVGGLGGPPRKSYPTLMNTLRDASGAKAGPNIRIGGNSADSSVYLPGNDPLPTNDTYRITDADLQLYAAAVPAWNGTIVLDVNLRNPSSPKLAVNHVVAAGKLTGWDLIEAIEIGNEVDLFARNGIRSPSYDYTPYAGEFAAYAAAIAAVVPEGGWPRIQGATWCSGKWDSHWGDYLSSFGSTMKSISYHHYPVSCPASVGGA